MRRGATAAALALAGLLLGGPLRAAAFDAEQTFRKGTVVLSVEAGYGDQDNLRGADDTGLEFWNAGVRFGWLPLGVRGPGMVRGAFEVALEPFYQRYFDPVDAYFAGLGLVGRYHFTTLGRFVPYVEAAGTMGSTDLRIREIDSAFTFLLFIGAGASYFVTDSAALYAGYRYQHVSNGNTSELNHGFESHTGVAGLSVFFP